MTEKLQTANYLQTVDGGRLVISPPYSLAQSCQKILSWNPSRVTRRRRRCLRISDRISHKVSRSRQFAELIKTRPPTSASVPAWRFRSHHVAARDAEQSSREHRDRRAASIHGSSESSRLDRIAFSSSAFVVVWAVWPLRRCSDRSGTDAQNAELRIWKSRTQSSRADAALASVNVVCSFVPIFQFYSTCS